MNVGIIGGGNLGSRLALLLQIAGHEVRVGVRRQLLPGEVAFAHTTLQSAAEHGEVVFIAIPFTACDAVLGTLKESLSGKIVVDATNPLQADWSPLLLGQEDSAGEHIATLLPRARVVKAFNSIFADVMTAQKLVRDGHRAAAFIAGDDSSALSVVERLAADMGFSPKLVGGLAASRYLEAMAHLNIAMYKKSGSTDGVFLYR
jgi:8-hydroxy-5-deazaflavin:NADPH oxidoreductase